MTKATKAAPKTSELATAENSAITVKAVSPAPIAADASAKWESFTACPVVSASLFALTATGDGVKLVWAHEQEFHTFRLFLFFVYDGLKAIFTPLFAVLWMAINSLYVWTRKPETKAAVAAKWQAVKGWAAPKFGYDREADRESAIEL